MTTHVHTIPVPHGMTPEQAWAEILVMGRLVDAVRIDSYANIRCDGDCGRTGGEHVEGLR